MNERTSVRRQRKSIFSDGLIRGALRILLRLFLAWGACVMFLSVLYWIVPPVSTLMIGDWLTGKTVTRTYVPLSEMSPHLPHAVMISEDAAFCAHSGVDWTALGTVIRTALRKGPSRGASTIPMQTSKNLFLFSSRSYIRKGLEIPLALYLDAIWSKRRMMEIYLNVAEWGNGIYGAEAAAQVYFRKPARLLTQYEAALLTVALPNPIQRNPSRPAMYQRTLAGQLFRRMNREGTVHSCLR